MAAGLGRALATEVRYDAISPETLQRARLPGSEELANMFQFNAEFARDYRAARDLETSRRLNPSLTSFDRWLEANAERIPLG